MAENNHQRTLALRAPRGVLFDRNGKVLVENRHSFNISIVREHTKDLDRTIRLLAQVAGLDAAQVQQTVDRHRGEPRYRPIVVIEDASLAQVAAVAARRLDFELPDVVVEQVPTRQYPPTRSRRTSSATSARRRGAGRRRRSPQGRSSASPGIERVYNKLLMGEDGARRVVVNSIGREIRTLEEDAADRGPARPADDRLRPAEGGGGRLPPCRLQRRGADHGSAQRRSADLRQPAGLRPERLRRRHRSRDVGLAQHRRAAAAAEPRDPGALLARVDVQDRRRDGGARGRARHARLHGELRRRRQLLRPLLQVPPEGRPRHRRHAPRDREVVQRLLLHARQHARRRPDPQVGREARDWRARPASTCRTSRRASCPQPSGS